MHRLFEAKKDCSLQSRDHRSFIPLRSSSDLTRYHCPFDYLVATGTSHLRAGYLMAVTVTAHFLQLTPFDSQQYYSKAKARPNPCLHSRWLSHASQYLFADYLTDLALPLAVRRPRALFSWTSGTGRRSDIDLEGRLTPF